MVIDSKNILYFDFYPKNRIFPIKIYKNEKEVRLCYRL